MGNMDYWIQWNSICTYSLKFDIQLNFEMLMSATTLFHLTWYTREAIYIWRWAIQSAFYEDFGKWGNLKFSMVKVVLWQKSVFSLWVSSTRIITLKNHEIFSHCWVGSKFQWWVSGRREWCQLCRQSVPENVKTSSNHPFLPLERNGEVGKSEEQLKTNESICLGNSNWPHY